MGLTLAKMDQPPSWFPGMSIHFILICPILKSHNRHMTNTTSLSQDENSQLCLQWKNATASWRTACWCMRLHLHLGYKPKHNMVRMESYHLWHDVTSVQELSLFLDVLAKAEMTAHICSLECSQGSLSNKVSANSLCHKRHSRPEFRVRTRMGSPWTSMDQCHEAWHIWHFNQRCPIRSTLLAKWPGSCRCSDCPSGAPCCGPSCTSSTGTPIELCEPNSESGWLGCRHPTFATYC